jgi:hypothetical protein
VFGRHARYRLTDVIAWENDQVAATDRRCYASAQIAEQKTATQRGGAEQQ